MKFQIGDIVALNSGSPEMTVSYLSNDYNIEEATCIWFCVPQQVFKQEKFQTALLFKVKEQ